MAVTPVNQNPVLEVEMPFLDKRRFHYGKESDMTGGSTELSHYQELMACVSTNGRCSIDSYVSVGEDFVLAFYTGPPVVYYSPVEQDPLPVN